MRAACLKRLSCPEGAAALALLDRSAVPVLGIHVDDALGHDAASYSSPGHVRLLTAALDWLGS